jgi:hypothetical protein
MMEIMTTTLKLVVSCELLDLHAPFDGACFEHAMTKVAQYTINDDKISKDLMSISVKYVQSFLQSCIT